MANFQPCKPFPQGFDTAAYKLTVPVGSVRFFGLFGGGPGGVGLKIQFTAGLITVEELSFDPGLVNGEPNVRVFRARGVTAGKGLVGAVLPSGELYTKELAFEVGADTDGTGTNLTQAFQQSRSLLQQAIQRLTDLSLALGAKASGLPVSLVGDVGTAHELVMKWLGTPPLTKPDGTKVPDQQQKAGETRVVVNQAVLLLMKNVNLKTSAGADPTVMRSPRDGFGLSYTSQPDLGVELCEECFSFAGPNCRHDVVTHEFFHLIGVGHGEAPRQKGLRFARRPLPTALALNSADHLAQLVAEITTGKCDACTRAAE